jgi:hypothetical protein
MATRDGEAVWLRRSTNGAPVHFAACPPRALGRNERLKDHFRAGRFFALLPLVSFLRDLCGYGEWVRPPLRGLIMFDDPNLRWPSYGYIDYRKLVHHAEACRYHVAMGMIPIDGRPVHPRAAALFRQNPCTISLLMHGLRHLRTELRQDLEPPAREALAARALRQVSDFERRCGIPVSRVMCPPHGEASEPFLGTLLKLGLEAFINDLPLPWTSVEAPTRAARLRGWMGASFVAGGLPVLPRHHFEYPSDDLVLRAFLDHPLIIYGHHDDLADGFQPVAQAADLLNSLGVRWGSASWIASTNFLTRSEEDILRVRLLSRRISLQVPPEATAIELEIPAVHGEVKEYEVLAGDILTPVRLSHTDSAVVSIRASPGPLTLELRPRVRLDPQKVRSPRGQSWPLVRRVMTEGRDRLKPLGGWRDSARWAS